MSNSYVEEKSNGLVKNFQESLPTNLEERKERLSFKYSDIMSIMFNEIKNEQNFQSVVDTYLYALLDMQGVYKDVSSLLRALSIAPKGVL